MLVGKNFRCVSVWGFSPQAPPQTPPMHWVTNSALYYGLYITWKISIQVVKRRHNVSACASALQLRVDVSVTVTDCSHVDGVRS